MNNVLPPVVGWIALAFVAFVVGVAVGFEIAKDKARRDRALELDERLPLARNREAFDRRVGNPKIKVYRREEGPNG